MTHHATVGHSVPRSSRAPRLPWQRVRGVVRGSRARVWHHRLPGSIATFGLCGILARPGARQAETIPPGAGKLCRRCEALAAESLAGENTGDNSGPQTRRRLQLVGSP